MVKLLVEKEADMESKDNNGQTPLSRAAGSGHEALVKLLLEKGRRGVRIWRRLDAAVMGCIERA